MKLWPFRRRPAEPALTFPQPSTPIADLVAKMLAAGKTAEQITAAVECVERMAPVPHVSHPVPSVSQTMSHDADDARRKRDRLRKRKWRKGKRRDIARLPRTHIRKVAG